jgi:FkbM family methyltransferase
MTMLRESLKRVANRLHGLQTRGLFESGYLKSLGFGARTIIDIGVHKGTRPLYDAFNECSFILIDPLRGIESLLEHKPARYSFINKGLAATAGTLLLHEQEAGKTTFLERTALTASPTVAQYEVETTTLDQVLDSIHFDPPIGIKIDTEGYELEVLKGLTRYWNVVEFIICEASIRRRFKASYQMSELVSYMAERGFLLFNFLNPVEPRPRYYDILFIHETNSLFD